MSEARTTIKLGDHGSGLCAWGRKTREQMIFEYRGFAQRRKDEAEAVLAASDDEFIVYQHTGVFRERNIVVLNPETDTKEGRKDEPT